MSAMWMVFLEQVNNNNDVVEGGLTLTPNVPLFTKQYNLVPCKGLHGKSAILLAAA